MSTQWISTGTAFPSSQTITHTDNDAEKGLCDRSSLPTLPPPVHVASEPTATEQRSKKIPSLNAKPIPIKKPVSPWISFHLWFNTYRKLFVLCTSLNLAAMISAGLGHFSYAVNNSGAMVLGNLLFAVLVRNELFIRLLYTLTICTLRNVLGSFATTFGSDVDLTTYWRPALRLRVISSGMTWAFVILSNMNTKDHGRLLRGQEVWFAIFITILIALPWATLREVPVQVEFPSPKVAIIRFDRGMQQGLTGRISRTAVKEFHAFGIVSEGINSQYHYMVCGVQGDFTRKILSDPPKTLWTRELKFAGVGHSSAMYKRGIRVCTGTGIGAALSTCIQSPNWFLIWIGSDQDKTFGSTITDLIYKHIEPKRMILWDTKKEGRRPDTIQLIKETWQRFEAEVVFITSNRQGNDEIMQGCYIENIPAFGTLWDF
ncbi:hypothetical protein FANTH_3857 [Fusarium anthophilum]|uniref:Non-ribosomal peptide synthetase n=1 Tax=Fusarium anthophilum TaxID=48485 RepID=A0A8H4ZRH7_9HYPO|nr:hypothetical protein FANTH_3857 [Fusarium anthophilum]